MAPGRSPGVFKFLASCGKLCYVTFWWGACLEYEENITKTNRNEFISGDGKAGREGGVGFFLDKLFEALRNLNQQCRDLHQ